MSDATSHNALRDLNLDFGETFQERFRVEGAVLKVTRHFDPRYQPRAEVELLRILQGLLDDTDAREIVLDLTDCVALPSMMVGCIHQAEHNVAAADRKLRIRMRADHYRHYDRFGLLNSFDADQPVMSPGADGVECLDLKSRPHNPPSQ